MCRLEIYPHYLQSSGVWRITIQSWVLAVEGLQFQDFNSGFVHPRVHKTPGYSRPNADKIPDIFRNFFDSQEYYDWYSKLPAMGPLCVVFTSQRELNLPIKEIHRNRSPCFPSHTKIQQVRRQTGSNSKMTEHNVQLLQSGLQKNKRAIDF